MGLRLHGRLTEVRPASEDDADLLVAWHADPYVSRYWDDETFTRDELLERLRRPDVDAYVVEAAGEPVGYLQAWREQDEPRRGGIDMFLVPSARGRGLGTRLVRESIDFARAQGYGRLVLWTQSNLAAARAIYRACGFELRKSAGHAAFGVKLTGEYWGKRL